MSKVKNVIAKPARMWIDGMCYNIRDTNKKSCKFTAMETITNSTDHENFNIKSTEAGKYSCSFRTPTIYYIKLNNLPDSTVEYLERETNTEIEIPKNGKDGRITITAEIQENVIKARHVIHSALHEIRARQPVLQFISVPVHSDEVKNKFEQFQKDILNGDPIKGVDETIFQQPIKLHLTVVVFTLSDETEIKYALNAFNDCKTEIIDPFIARASSLKIKIAGIDCMNDTLEKVHVLYANAEILENEGNRLQQLVNNMSDFFYQRGLLKKYEENVKLHVTLMNTKYRKSPLKSPEKKRSRWSSKRQPFDARPIIKKYKDYHFGECHFNSIHFSLISSIGDDGFYKPISVLKI